MQHRPSIVHIAGIPVRAELLIDLARLVDDDKLASRLENAYSREERVLGLSLAERETQLVALDDPPPGLEELRAELLGELVRWKRDGLT